MEISNIKVAGRWNHQHHKLPFQYGKLNSYILASEWLKDCDVVEDWGCGCGFAKQFFNKKYIGIDGSPSKWCDIVKDLTTYNSNPDGLLMRHVLEHNYNWRIIIKNATSSFKKRMVLVMFIPPGDQDTIYNPQICVDVNNGIPDISCCRTDLINIISPFLIKTLTLPKTYNPDIEETLYFMEK